MTLPARPMHIPAGVPINEAVRQELLDAGQANLAAINVRSRDQGGLDKRLGFASLTKTLLDGTSLGSGLSVFNFGAQPCVIDAAKIRTYSSALSRWVDHGNISEATYTRKVVPSPDPAAIVRDVAVSSTGVKVISTTVVGTNQSHHVLSVIDSSGAIIRGPERITGTGTAPYSIEGRLAQYGAIIVAVTAFQSSAIWLQAHYLDTTSVATINAGWTLITGTQIATDLLGVDLSYLDVASLSDRVAIAYTNTSGGTNKMTVLTLNAGGVLATTTINTSSNTPSGVSLSEGSFSPQWVAWGEGFNVKACGLDPTTLAVTATTALIVTSATINNDTWIVATAANAATLYAQTNTSSNVYMRGMTVVTGATTPGAAAQSISGVSITGRPFIYNGATYTHLSSRNLEEIVLCDVTLATANIQFRPVAVPIQRGDYSLATGIHPRARTAVTTTSSVFDFAFQSKAEANARATVLVEYNFADINRWAPALANGSMFLGGGMLSIFDGKRAFEAAFLVRPNVTIDVSVAGSQSFTIGRSYVATFEEMDAFGNWHISGVSTPVNTGIITSKTVKLSIDPLAITSRVSVTTQSYGSGVRIGVWGTDDGGKLYYRVGTVQNDATTATLSVTDSLTALQLTSNALLYGTGNLPDTNGASQDHRAPPGLPLIVGYNGMIVGATGHTIYFSSQPIDGEGQWFSPAFSCFVDDDVTALAVQDGSVIAFTANAVYAVVGTAPSDNGANGGLSDPQRIPIDSGAISPVTCTTSLGTFFVSKRGIEIYSRSGGVEWIGKPIQKTFAAYPVVSAMVFDPVNNILRVSFAASSASGAVTGNGVDEIYDFTSSGWISQDQKQGSRVTEPAQDAMMTTINGVLRYAWLGTGGTLYYEKLSTDSDAYLDGANWVQSQYETAPLKLGLSQEQRTFECELLFQQHSAAGITIEVSHDFGSYAAVTPDKVWAEAATLNQIRLPFRPKPLSSAVKFRVRDTAPAVLGNGQGFTFVGITADIAPKQGPTRGTPRLATSLRR